MFYSSLHRPTFKEVLQEFDSIIVDCVIPDQAGAAMWKTLSSVPTSLLSASVSTQFDSFVSFPWFLFVILLFYSDAFYVAFNC